VRPEALHEVLQNLEKRRGELELAVNPEALRREVAAAKTSFDSLCRKLSLKRRAGAEALGKAVTAAMQQLAMAGGRFSVSLRKLDEPGVSGAEGVEFEVSSHPSLPLRPLAKVVSGGELSRISLAIQLVAAKASPVASLVFDEIDSGSGNDQWSVSRAGVKVKVQRLDRTARIVELARMLGGAESTARRHAAELLDAT
jgi:DNA repair protein RecN (Recombination protein N)